jgi:hypothetical protein
LKISNNKKFIKEIKYFSPDGKSLPNGHPLQKGGFIKECRDNINKFKSENYKYFITKDFRLVEAIHHNQYGLSDYRGGIITFSTEVNSLKISDSILSDWLIKKLKTYYNRFFLKYKLSDIIKRFNSSDKEVDGKEVDDYIGAFSIGNFFSGRYIGDNVEVFDEKSICIEINGLSSNGLIYLAEEISKDFSQETVLLKDMNINKIFLVNSDRTGSYDLKLINKKSL